MTMTTYKYCVNVLNNTKKTKKRCNSMLKNEFSTSEVKALAANELCMTLKKCVAMEPLPPDAIASMS